MARYNPSATLRLAGSLRTGQALAREARGVIAYLKGRGLSTHEACFAMGIAINSLIPDGEDVRTFTRALQAEMDNRPRPRALMAPDLAGTAAASRASEGAARAQRTRRRREIEKPIVILNPDD